MAASQQQPAVEKWARVVMTQDDVLNFFDQQIPVKIGFEYTLPQEYVLNMLLPFGKCVVRKLNVKAPEGE